MSKVISESQLNEKISQIYQEELYKVIEEKWSRLSSNDKEFVIETLKIIYPEKSNLVTESKWYNTVGDIVGIFDPTGVVDLINGISYWRQGDKIFALLSWISVIPYVGDLVAKPVVGLFKMGGASAKAFKAASLAGDAAKMAEIAKTSGPLKGLLTKVNQWAPKVLEPLGKAVEKVPGVGKGMVKSVENFINLFKDAGKTMTKAADTAIDLTARKVSKGLSKAESKELQSALRQATNFKGFRNLQGKQSWLQYMKSDASFLSKLSVGVPRLWGNPATRALMGKTRWYLGLLDFLGIANFVGPDELEKQVPNLDEKVAQYSETSDSQNLFSQDMSTAGANMTEPQPENPEDIWKKASQGVDLTGGVTPTTIAPEKTLKNDDIFGGLFA